VELDNPRLTARIDGVVNQPLRIVVDPSNRIPPTANVFSDEAETWHLTGKVDLNALLDRLMLAGHIGLLVEGGAHTLGQFLTADLVDELRLFVSPKLLGAGRGWVEGLVSPLLDDQPLFQFESVEKIGPDIELRVTRNRQ
jgi:diaminohydroxyphosphoribosylaminopyrimidine deaminase/5-amino-6-(5-phosphoribosylamino)uracil reductase